MKLSSMREMAVEIENFNNAGGRRACSWIAAKKAVAHWLSKSNPNWRETSSPLFRERLACEVYAMALDAGTVDED